MCKLCWALLVSAVLAVIVAVVTIAGGNSTSPGRDGREVILLKPEQRDLVLTEMRTFVVSAGCATGHDESPAYAVQATRHEYP
jgi:hypothetical protein